MNKKWLFIPLLLFLLLAVSLMWQLLRNAAGDDPTRLESTLLGKKIPDFQLAQLQPGTGLITQRIFQQGQPRLLNVWATWCPTCHQEHQYLKLLASQGVSIIGVNYKDQRQQALNWLNFLGNPYTLSLFDGDGMYGLDLGVYGAPETFLIDGQGVIRYRVVGEVNQHVWETQLRPLWRHYSSAQANR